MKKANLFAVVLLCAAVLASCSKSEETTPVIEEMIDVTFSLSAENAIQTRAISDGTGADCLMFGVFDDEGTIILPKAVKNNVTGLTSTAGHSMTISLAKGHTYQVAFWAQDADCTAYTVSDDMKVSIDYTGINNDEARDAFFATTEPFTVDRSTTIGVTLKRPLAQVNVGAFPFDYEQAQHLGVDITRSSATVKGIANVLNLYDGTVSGETEVSYSLSTIPEEDLLVDVDEDKTPETYVWLSMSYILADKASTTHTMSFAFADANGNNVTTFGDGLGAVPIQRNYRTNIVGQILTGAINFNIKIDPIYEGETINSAGLYYNFSEDTTIENKVFAFNTHEAATFTTENESLITLKDVTFSGKVQYIAFGDYWKVGNEVIVPFKNVLTNVVAKNMVVTHSKGINNVQPIDYMAPLVFLRGETTLTDCEFTGTTSIAPDITDYNGNVQPVIAYDCGVPNDCVATFNNCTVDAMYAWSHSQITLKDTKVKYLRCSTHNQSQAESHLTIDAGSVVDEIVVTSSGLSKFVTIEGKKTLTADLWAPKLIIKAGAHVKKLDMNGRSRWNYNTIEGERVYESAPDVIIEAGAVVDEIINENTTDVPPTPLP